MSLLVEPCPPELQHLRQPEYGGSLFFNEGIAGCPRCGWSGIPTFHDAVASTWCPACQHDSDAQAARVPRNQPCPCGSGVKAKRCDCEAFCV